MDYKHHFIQSTQIQILTKPRFRRYSSFQYLKLRQMSRWKGTLLGMDLQKLLNATRLVENWLIRQFKLLLAYLNLLADHYDLIIT